MAEPCGGDGPLSDRCHHAAMSSNRATVKDVARESGFSLATCVHILGGREARYAEATVAVVQAAAQRLGYRRNAQARAMRVGRTGSIALLGPQQAVRGVLTMEFLESLEIEVARRQHHLALARLSDDVFTADGVLPTLLHEWACDGVLVNYQQEAPPALEQMIDASDLPAIWINAKRKRDCVYPDEAAGLAAATQRLIDLGHRRIAWADAPYGALGPESHFSVMDRWQGYADVMRAAALIPRALIAAGEGYLEEHTHAVRAAAWAAEAQRPTAIISTHADLIASIIVAWRSRGLDVPRDLSLIAVAPRRVVVIGQPVDTVHIPNATMAVRAVDLLLQRVAHGRHVPAEAVSMPYDQAGSTASAPR